MMPDILKYPTDFQIEVAGLIPNLIENLGNSKVRLLKPCHENLGHRSEINTQSNWDFCKTIKKVGACSSPSY